jgi:hypothetical protein
VTQTDGGPGLRGLSTGDETMTTKTELEAQLREIEQRIEQLLDNEQILNLLTWEALGPDLIRRKHDIKRKLAAL